MASRSISSILSKASNQKTISWHRIVYAGGKVWFNPETKKKRRALYKREGILINQQNKIINFEEVHHSFD
ncbi:MAG TPA: hypothetical protein PKA42_00980 [Candidatus Paceibacterota bacterium]|nr:hypothetical protein [Candidatus Paceibacterota bacterium]HMO82717.1 hypothetical protein [Candidatus Paceibacterota bacterium]